MRKWVGAAGAACLLVAAAAGIRLPDLKSSVPLLSPVTVEERSSLHPLVGEISPATTLKLLDGSSVELAALEGEKVVALDFWASWCGPCRAALPEVQAAADALADKDVVFYAVNLHETPGEDADTWNRFKARRIAYYRRLINEELKRSGGADQEV
jgi:thiol-disulfide isomerase/thioredoxin